MVVAIRDPVLLTEIGGAVYDEVARIFIVGDCGLHLHGVVAIAELRETEAANCLQAVNLIKEVVVAAVMEGEARASEEIQLHGVLDGLSGVNKADKLM